MRCQPCVRVHACLSQRPGAVTRAGCRHPQHFGHTSTQNSQHLSHHTFGHFTLTVTKIVTITMQPLMQIHHIQFRPVWLMLTYIYLQSRKLCDKSEILNLQDHYAADITQRLFVCLLLSSCIAIVNIRSVSRYSNRFVALFVLSPNSVIWYCKHILQFVTALSCIRPKMAHSP